MNHLPGTGIRDRQSQVPEPRVPNTAKPGVVLCCVLAWTSSCNAPAFESAGSRSDSVYRLEFRVAPQPEAGVMNVRMQLQQSRFLLREVRMQAPAAYFDDFTSDGTLSVDGDTVTWQPPRAGGTLSWNVVVNRQRTDDSYDAYMNADWALFRGSDIVPAATTRTLKGATSDTTLAFTLPEDWTSTTQYAATDNHYPVINPDRRYDRPTGWILLGQTGTRTDKISGVRVTIAGPKDQDVRRLDMLALLRWTIPEATRLFQKFPARLTVFSAGEPMWRGGLSAPESLYIHSSRPLLSENGTSTLLHEIVHVAMGVSAVANADWIVEGFAEYYSLRLLLQSGTISQRRFDMALDKLRNWGGDAHPLCAQKSSGAITARATVIMHLLDQEIRQSSSGKHSLDDVMNSLVSKEKKITIGDLKNATATLLQKESKVLRRAKLGDCSDNN